ncbi:hypothetical protein IW136_001589, partial [Coemansia sp. RSA 678]
AALVNDTVGTLLSAAYSDPTAQMGVILGTGTNAAYYEDEANVAKWKGEGGEIVLNMEWGAFDSDDFSVLPFTQHDIKLDRKSINPRKQAYEKMISGMYLGEIARNVMLWLADQRLLLDGRSSEVLNAMWSIDTAYLSAATVDDSPDLEEIKQIIEKTLNVPQSTLVDRQIFKVISILVGERSARLSAVGIVATLTKRPELLNKPINVGIDGSMYEHYPEFERIMAETVSHFIPPEQFKNVKFSLAKDGSGLLTRGTRALALKRKARQQEVELVEFDPKARQTFLTGFHKRKVERQEKAASEIKTQERQDMLQMRKERREQQRDQLAEKLMMNDEFKPLVSSDDEDVEVLQGEQSVTTVTVTRGFDAEEMDDKNADLERRLTPQEVAVKLKRDLQKRIERAQKGSDDEEEAEGEDEGDDKKKKKPKTKTKTKNPKKFRYETKAKRAASNAKSKAAKNKGKDSRKRK